MDTQSIWLAKSNHLRKKVGGVLAGAHLRVALHNLAPQVFVVHERLVDLHVDVVVLHVVDRAADGLSRPSNGSTAGAHNVDGEGKRRQKM